MARKTKLTPAQLLSDIQKLFPDYNPLMILAEASMDQLYRSDPINQIPIHVPCDPSLRVQAAKGVAEYIYAKQKAVEISVDTETLAKQQVLANVPLAVLVATLQAGDKQPLVIEHEPQGDVSQDTGGIAATAKPIAPTLDELLGVPQ